MTEAVKKAVAAYIALRDEKKTIQARHKEELKPINERMMKIEGKLLAYLTKSGQQNAKTTEGTAYLTTTTSAKVEEWGPLKQFVLENDMVDMLEHRVSKDAVEEYIESTGDVPPGVSINRETNCRIKR